LTCFAARSIVDGTKPLLMGFFWKAKDVVWSFLADRELDVSEALILTRAAWSGATAVG